MVVRIWYIRTTHGSVCVHELYQTLNLKGIFRVGIGRDNVPEKEAKEKGKDTKPPIPKTKFGFSFFKIKIDLIIEKKIVHNDINFLK